MESSNGHGLVERIRQTDYDAFEEMHQLYYANLFRLAARKIGDEDEAYDVLQDMFTELWEKRESLYVPNSLEAWLRNRLWFKLSGYFRSKGFREKHFRLFSEFPEVDKTVFTDDLEAREINVQYEAVIELVKRTIDEMPHSMKTVFLMSRDGNNSIKEIASKLKLSPKTVKNQVNLALNRIREALSDRQLTAMEVVVILWLTQC